MLGNSNCNLSPPYREESWSGTPVGHTLGFLRPPRTNQCMCSANFNAWPTKRGRLSSTGPRSEHWWGARIAENRHCSVQYKCCITSWGVDPMHCTTHSLRSHERTFDAGHVGSLGEERRLLKTGSALLSIRRKSDFKKKCQYTHKISRWDNPDKQCQSLRFV
jgi:hypothetical protein